MEDRTLHNRIVQRIVRESNIPELMEVLTERISMTDLQLLLLEVYKRRAAKLSAAAVLKQYKENRFVRLANISPQESIEFDRLAYSLLPGGFEVVELSPVCPLGACSVLATVDQNNTVATVRNTEVCADSTNVLALECATRRRKSGKGEGVHDTKLCASHRLLRGQVFKGPVSFSHFRVFSLCTAGRDRGNYGFEIDALCEQVDFYLRLLLESRRLGFVVGQTRVTMTPFAGGKADLLERHVIAKLATKHGEVAFGLDEERQRGRGYYIWAGFRINANDPEGTECFLIDGGFTNWAEKLMSNRKERLLVSGMGTERFLICFKRSGLHISPSQDQ
jgi:hypothetical protein